MSFSKVLKTCQGKSSLIFSYVIFNNQVCELVNNRRYHVPSQRSLCLKQRRERYRINHQMMSHADT